MYYRSLAKAESCLGHSKEVEVDNVLEIQSLYCSGLDLQIPLVSSLSPCSDQHKNKVEECINEFATTFINDSSDPSLCRYLQDPHCFLVVLMHTVVHRPGILTSPLTHATLNTPCDVNQSINQSVNRFIKNTFKIFSKYNSISI